MACRHGQIWMDFCASCHADFERETWQHESVLRESGALVLDLDDKVEFINAMVCLIESMDWWYPTHRILELIGNISFNWFVTKNTTS